MRAFGAGQRGSMTDRYGALANAPRRNLRALLWIPPFFVVLAAMLLPFILAAKRHDAGVPLWLQLLIVLSASLVCQALRRRRMSELFGRFNLRWAFELCVGAALGALMMAAPALLLAALGAVTWTPSAISADAFFGALLVLAAAAATEEVLFRGFLFQRLIDGLGAWPAQIVIAAFFTLTHADALRAAGQSGNFAAVNIFLASILFGVAFLRTRSLAMPIGIHFAANAVQGAILGFGVSGGEEVGLLRPALIGHHWLTGGAFGLEASAPGLAAVAALIAAFMVVARRPGAVAPPADPL
jgi:membrane protease YdiL (CAAX protease family)